MDAKILIGIVIAVVIVAGGAAVMHKGNVPETSTSVESSPAATSSATTTTSTPETTASQTTSTAEQTATSTTSEQTTTSGETATTSQTTVQPTTTATTTATGTTTTTSTSTAVLESYSDVSSLLKTFTHMKYVFTWENQTSGEKSTVEVSYTVHVGETVTINGQEAVRVDFTLVEPDNPESSGNLTVWFTPDYKDLVRVVVEAGGQTQTIEGPQLQYLSQQIRYMLFAPIMATGDLNMILAIEEAKLAAAKNGWEITSTESTTVTISGESYKAIEGTAVNVADANSTTTKINAVVANLEDSLWYTVYMEWWTKDGGHGKIELAELTKA